MNARDAKPVKLLAAALGTTLALAGAAQAANLLTNPSFEDPVLAGGDTYGSTGWTAFGAAYTIRVLPQSGDQALKMFGTPSGVFQDFAASPGQTYTASAWAANPNFDAMAADQIAAINVEWRNAGGLISFDTVRILEGTPADSVYRFASLTATAPAGTTIARFVLITGAFNDVNGDTQIVGGGAPFFDNASFDLVVPEPASLTLAGVAGLGFLARRRKVENAA
jgi:hypothetical protein